MIKVLDLFGESKFLFRKVFMAKKEKILIENEKQANYVVAKVMRITFVFFTVLFLLNVIGVFVVDQTVMLISYIAGSDLPALLVNVQRGGPGLGGIQPSQSDYFQAVKGGSHGDFKKIVLAPSSVQEMASLTCFRYWEFWRLGGLEDFYNLLRNS